MVLSWHGCGDRLMLQRHVASGKMVVAISGNGYRMKHLWSTNVPSLVVSWALYRCFSQSNWCFVWEAGYAAFIIPDIRSDTCRAAQCLTLAIGRWWTGSGTRTTLEELSVPLQLQAALLGLLTMVPATSQRGQHGQRSLYLQIVVPITVLAMHRGL